MALPRVAVLGGSGRHGRGLACRLARAGYPVVIGSRDASRAAGAVQGWRRAEPIATAALVDAVNSSPIVILAVPFEALNGLLPALSDQLVRGALVVDVTVPLTFAEHVAALAPVPEGSAAEHVRARLPAHVRLAATFKTLPAHLLHDTDARLDCDEFVCGESSDARAEAASLVDAIEGLRAVDVGPLARARSIEHLTLLAVGINRRHRIRDARFRVVGL